MKSQENSYQKVRRLEHELSQTNTDNWELVEASLELAHKDLNTTLKKAAYYDQLIETYIQIKEEYANSFMGTPQQEKSQIISYLDRLDKIIMASLAELSETTDEGEENK